MCAFFGLGLSVCQITFMGPCVRVSQMCLDANVPSAWCQVRFLGSTLGFLGAWCVGELGVILPHLPVSKNSCVFVVCDLTKLE